MGDVTIAVWLAAGYSVFLLATAHGLDLLARRTSKNTARWHTGAFVYHADHDAWLCPEDQWLWPQSFDPDNRLMRYRASPAVCNSCPVKDTCTTSTHGREVTRAVDPWPASEAERFHRGIACAVAVLGAVWPFGMMFGGRTTDELLILGGALLVVAAGSLPLWSHLRRSPAAFPDHVKVEVPDEAAAARAVDAAREARRRSGYTSDRARREAKERRRTVYASDRTAARAVDTAAGPATATATTEAGEPTMTERDRFATRWGAFDGLGDGETPPGGWSRRRA